MKSSYDLVSRREEHYKEEKMKLLKIMNNDSIEPLPKKKNNDSRLNHFSKKIKSHVQNKATVALMNLRQPTYTRQNIKT